MYNKEFITEAVVSLALVVLLVLFINPTMFWMPDSFAMMLLLLLVVLYTLFASFIWKEKVHDEREGYHKLLASRAGFIVGTIVLVFGVGTQWYTEHQVDPWLLVALGAMVLAKIGGRLIGISKY